jgi:EAL domain-containing protein (putative c-di-GMP-specific phosphodiesterase class I)/CheY-like chemotaxis protein
MRRVLVAEADEGARQELTAQLDPAWGAVDAPATAEQAIARVRDRPHDVVLCNIALPRMDALELLRRIRLHDLDVPVVLLAPSPGLPSAARALEHGAFRILVRPYSPADLTRTLDDAHRFLQLARARRKALQLLGGQPMALGDRASLEGRFQRAIEQLLLVFQPVVHWRERRVVGYEALLRSEEPDLDTPALLLDAAARLGRGRELSRLIRAEVARRAPEAPAGAQLFVNLLAADLLDEQLCSPRAPLSALAGRVVLELSERASFDELLGAAERVAALRKLGFRIALDDVGAGYAGLTALTQLRPDYVKIDYGLISSLERNPLKQSIVGTIGKLGRELGLLVVAEGIETAEERDSAADLGCDHQQGFLFGRPAQDFEPARL